MLLLAGGLLATTLVFLIAQAWIAAAVFALITVACITTGAVGSPHQVAAALAPEAITTVEAAVWQSKNRPWLVLGPDEPTSPAVELRWRGQAKRMAQRHFPVKVVGRLEPGHYVVLQVGQVTLWPAGKVRDRLTKGAYRLAPEDMTLLRRLRIRGRGMLGP
jgi:hypothetical protein